MKNGKPRSAPRALDKAPTGIRGLDEITGGGLPRNRPTLVCGSPGSGKTLLGMEFLVRGAVRYGEPGVFFAFEETEEELVQNTATLGFDLHRLSAQKKLRTEYIRIERHEIEETGEYDLEGLFIRIGAAIDAIHARRVVLDTVEVLFACLTNHGIVRAEIRRRVVKYRGSAHGANEYPFLITNEGLSVAPITSLGLQHEASTKRISSGVPRLDALLGGPGYNPGR